MFGRKAEGFQIEPVNGELTLELQPLIECDQIPTNRSEIPTPKIALLHPHLKTIASHIPSLDSNAQILLLLGRDIVRVHKVRQQINGPHNAPFAQKSDLGWVVIGEVCIGKAHKPDVHTFKTHVLENGRSSYFKPCDSCMHMKEKVCHVGEQWDNFFNARKPHLQRDTGQNLGHSVFQITKSDNKLALSVEDTAFLEIMNTEVYRDEENNWVAPLPFRVPRVRLPNNRRQALSWLTSLCRMLERRPVMKQQFLAFMEKIFADDHAEQVAPVDRDKECWYLPMFGIYHPQKPDQIRVVFGSS